MMGTFVDEIGAFTFVFGMAMAPGFRGFGTSHRISHDCESKYPKDWAAEYSDWAAGMFEWKIALGDHDVQIKVKP
jgi:hypothetical protein